MDIKWTDLEIQLQHAWCYIPIFNYLVGNQLSNIKTKYNCTLQFILFDFHEFIGT